MTKKNELCKICLCHQKEAKTDFLAMSSLNAIENQEVKASFIIEAKEKMLEDGIWSHI